MPQFKMIVDIFSKKLRYKVTIDRPKGYIDEYGNVYPLNYGYISGILAGDGEEQDAYVFHDNDEEYVNGDVFIGDLIAIIYREDDLETKWIISDKDNLTKEDIRKHTYFLEKYFKSTIYILGEIL